MDMELLQLQQKKQELPAILQQYQMELAHQSKVSLNQQCKIEELEQYDLDANQQLRDRQVEIERQDNIMSSMKDVVLKLLAENAGNKKLCQQLHNVLKLIDPNHYDGWNFHGVYSNKCSMWKFIKIISNKLNVPFCYILYTLSVG